MGPVPEYRNTVPPWLPLALLAPRKAHPRSATFRVPAVTMTWLAVEIVAQGSITVVLAVEMVRLDAMDWLPVKLRASHTAAIDGAHRGETRLQFGSEVSSGKLVGLPVGSELARSSKGRSCSRPSSGRPG